MLDCHAELGEGPVWDPEEHVLYWVNIKDHEIHRFDPATGNDTFGRRPRTSARWRFAARGGLGRGAEDGFLFLRPAERNIHGRSPSRSRIVPDNRFNDGKTDRQGRFWAGSLYDPDETKPTGGLYSVSIPTARATGWSTASIASNALAFSPDSRTMSYGDSRQRIVWAWDFHAADGAISNRRVFIELQRRQAIPDGAAVDFDGCYWLTQPPAGPRRALRSEGARRPGDRDAGVAADLRRLRRGGDGHPLHHLGQVQVAGGEDCAEPLAGALFAVRPGVAVRAEVALRRLFRIRVHEAC